MINNNPKYQQPPSYNANGNHQQMRSNVVHSSNVAVGMSSQQQMHQQQIQQKYYDQYENQMRQNGNNNGNHNGMSQSTYNPVQKAPAQQYSHTMTSSYNQQMNYNNQQYNNHQQNGSSGIGKISDYDPMTDSPRNIPQAARPNQTLIYSSDRAASK